MLNKKNDILTPDNNISIEIINNKIENNEKKDLNKNKKIKIQNNEMNCEEKKENFLNKEKEYKLIISNLEKELEEERNKFDDLKIKETSNIVVHMLKNDISKINNETEEILKLNIMQRKKLENVGKEIDSRLKKINLKVITKKIKEENYKKNVQKNKQIKKLNKIEKGEEKKEKEDLKMIDKQIENVKKLMNNLKKENELLNEKYNKTNNLKLQFQLKKNNKVKELEIEKINKEIKQLNNKLKEHSKCIEVKDDYEKKIKLARDEIEYEKVKKDNLNEKLLHLNKRIIKISNFNEQNKSKKMRGSISQQNIFSTNILVDNKNNLIIKKQVRDLSKVLSPRIKYLSQKELNYLFIALNKDKNEYENILKKFKIYEVNLKLKESTYKHNIKEKRYIKSELDEKLNYLQIKNGENIIQKDLLNSQYNELLINNTSTSNKLNNLNKQIKSVSDEIKEKDKNIKILTTQLKTLRDLINNSNYTNFNTNIKNYIHEIQKESRNSLNEHSNRIKTKTFYSNSSKKKIKIEKKNNKNTKTNIIDNQNFSQIKVTKRNNSMNEFFFTNNKK